MLCKFLKLLHENNYRFYSQIMSKSVNTRFYQFYLFYFCLKKGKNKFLSKKLDPTSLRDISFKSQNLSQSLFSLNILIF